MFITPPVLTKRVCLRNPDMPVKALAKACTEFVLINNSFNICAIHSPAVSDLDKIAFAGYLNLKFCENKSNNTCLVLHIDPLLDTMKRQGYYTAINALQTELGELTRTENNLFFLIADPETSQNYTEWKSLKTYLTSKTDIKSVMLMDDLLELEKFMHVHKDIHCNPLGEVADERTTDT